MKSFNSIDAFDSKQHVGFSQYTYDLLKSDYAIFNPDGKPDSWNAFLNKIIMNFQDLHLAPADITTHYNELYNDYAASITARFTARKGQELLEHALENFRITYIENYATTLLSPNVGKLSKTFNLNPMLINRLGDMKGSIEDEIFVRPGKYINAIFESYARKPFLDRERIVLNEQYERIERAITRKKCIRFIHTNGHIYTCFPYKLQSDKMGNYLYVAGVMVTEETRTYVSFRLSRLHQIREVSVDFAPLHETEEDALEEMILEKGIQFIVGQPIHALVKFTPHGMKKFENVLHRRPQVVQKHAEDTFEFVSTKEQLEYYFFSFGKDAVILEPKELRAAIAEQYLEAYRAYDISET